MEAPVCYHLTMITLTTAAPDLPSPDSTVGAFLNQLCRLVLKEAEHTREQAQRVWSQPLSERVAAGRAIADVHIRRVYPDGLIELSCSHNDSRFREGDILCLSRGSPFYEPNLLVTLELDEETELLVSTEDLSVIASMVFDERDGWALDEGYLDFSATVLDALNQAGDTAAGRTRVLPLLMGQSRPRIDIERYERAYDRAEGWGMGEQQCEALAQAYASDLAYLIQGPPGTGKTQLLARLAQLLAEEGERVLVSAFTHRAINNALNKLAELNARFDATPATIAKIGRLSRADDLHIENYATFADSPLTELSGGYIVGATPFATRTQRLSGVEFDTVIFDEASQITLPLAIMGMLVAKRFVFIGDQRQLPPVLATRHEDRVLHESVFATLVDRGFDTMLEETYRMNAELTAWPSAQFYDNRLRPASDVANRRVVYSRPPMRLAHILNPQEPKIYVDLAHRNATTRCEAEASLTVDLITALLESGISPNQIGVVAPYRAQGRAIRSLLRQALPHDPSLRRTIVIDTVERMQGQERDVVIISLTTSNPIFATNLADFFFQPERLNVAITRPRSKLIILGSSHVLLAAPADPDDAAAVELLRDLLMSCVRRSITYHT
jgi:DNA replication ATP-dependent helicase Dna2